MYTTLCKEGRHNQHHNSGLVKLDFEVLFADLRPFVNDLEVHSSVLTIPSEGDN
jgi:hypothetical protein